MLLGLILGSGAITAPQIEVVPSLALDHSISIEITLYLNLGTHN